MSGSFSRRALLRAGVAMPVLAGCQAFLPPAAGRIGRVDVRVTAPFAMPSIAAAHAAGGGGVVVPPGTWPTGPVHLKSHVALHVEEGATLLFSSDPRDYLPAVPTSWEGLECMNYSLSGGVENVFVDDCHVDHADSPVPSSINNLLYVKTNERRGGYVRNIHMTNVSATRIKGGVLAVESDVLYQWKTLLPTLERRLTPIEGLFVAVRTVRGTPVVTEHVTGFDNRADVRA